jgi:transposase
VCETTGLHELPTRVLLPTRGSAVDVRRDALVQLCSVIVSAPEHLHDGLRQLPAARLNRRSAASAASTRARRTSWRSCSQLRSLARRIVAVTAEANELDREIISHVRALVPQLLDQSGVGPIVAAQLMISWSHRDRVRSDAALARLAGVPPLLASSGQTIRHRPSRGGDRQLNHALHTVALHRHRHDAARAPQLHRAPRRGRRDDGATRILERYRARPLARHAKARRR